MQQRLPGQFFYFQSMHNHIQTGKTGESLATAYFINKGFDILYRNWRHKRLEVDIIAVKDAVLHFIEVKTRTSDRFGPPEEKVTEKKLRSLINASEAFLHQYPQWQRICFDVLSVTLGEQGKADFFLIEDVYL